MMLAPAITWARTVAAVLAVLAMASASPSVAQPPGDELPPPETPPGATGAADRPAELEATDEVGRERTRLAPPSFDFASLETRWYAFRAAAPGSEAEARAFEALRVSAIELGLIDLPAHSLLLLLEAGAAHRAGDEIRATSLRDWAATLSSSSAQPFFFDAGRLWDSRPWDVPGIVAVLAEAYGRLHSSLAGRAALGMKWRALVTASMIAFGLVFAFVIALRHASLLAYDLRLLAHKTLTLRQAVALTALLFVAPPLILWSPFGFVLAALALTGAYLSVSERVIALVVLGACVALPPLTSDYARLVAANQRNASRVVAAVGSPCDERCMEQLERRTDREGDSNAALARAWCHYRAGTSRQRRRAIELLDGRDFEPAAQSSVEVLRGNIAFVVDRPVAAERHYARAHELALTSTQRAAALFNLYRLHSAEGRRDAAQESLAAALREDPELVDRHVDFRGRSQNLILAVSPLPTEVLADDLLDRQDDPIILDATRELMAGWYGLIDLDQTRALALACGAWILLGVLLARRRLTSVRCRECATPVSRFISAAAYGDRRCLLCYQARSMPAVLTADQRRAREDRIERWEVFWEQLELMTSLVLPGVGQIGAGRTLLGALLLATLCCGGVLLVLAGGQMDIPYSLAADRSFDGSVQAGLMLLSLAYLLAASSYLISRRRHS